MRSEKLKWERVNGGFDLICQNPDQIDIKAVKKLLQKIVVIYNDYNKPFDRKASKLWREWIDNPNQPLREAAYCLLSNWFLSGQFAANTCIRAGLNLLLWNKLFYAIPKSRLTDWKKGEDKVIKERFEQWWQEQEKRQKDC